MPICEQYVLSFKKFKIRTCPASEIFLATSDPSRLTEVLTIEGIERQVINPVDYNLVIRDHICFA